MTLECRFRASAGAYAIRVEPGLSAAAPALLADFARGKRTHVVSDTTVWKLHGSAMQGAGIPCTLVPAGELRKSWSEVERLLGALVQTGVDRSSMIVALGGGAVGDLAGFAASVYMRGIPWIYLPTTLLAQVDACVGGKTAVNLAGGKNLAGAFHPPRAVFVDPSVLGTLPAPEYASGLAEVVKYAVVSDPELFGILEERSEAILARDPKLLADTIRRCLAAKIAVVEADERDQGRRRILNFGHTWGHALEAAARYEGLRHGEAVAIGMILAAELSARLGILADPDLPARLERLLTRLGLPTRAQKTALAAARAFLPVDKKGTAGRPAFILPERLGRARFVENVEVP